MVALCGLLNLNLNKVKNLVSLSVAFQASATGICSYWLPWQATLQPYRNKDWGFHSTDLSKPQLSVN